MIANTQLDDIDRQIISELAEDGRRSLREIARNLRIPEATVRLRLRRLQDDGRLRILAFADPTKFGSTTLALMFVTVEPGSHSDLVQKLQSWPEVAYLSTTLGDADLCVQVFAEDETALREVFQRLRQEPGVGAVRILLEVEVHKLRFGLPQLADSASET
jgi:Lrp/AsnC family transcriptional regulator for asnA, asnC and gidA